MAGQSNWTNGNTVSELIVKKLYLADENGEVTASATEINKLDGFTASTEELNILDGVTASTAELNILDGVTSSTAELNALDGIGTTAMKVLKYTVTADDQTATTVSIPAGLTVAGFVCTILRDGKDVTNKAAISGSTTNLVVATNSTDYVLTAADVIQAFVWA